jgi:transposase-like protein
MEQKPRTLLEAIRIYADADTSLNEAVDSRWEKGVICPRCDGERPVFIKTRRIWMCSKCRKQFSFKAGTLLEDSPIGLDKWLPAVWMIANDKNGISSWELHRALGVTQKSAWFMLHRIRLGMQDARTGGKLGGSGNGVEVDETFIGGKARNMHADAKARKIQGRRGPEGKAIVAAVLERGGKVRAKVIDRRRKTQLQALVRENVEPKSALYSDALKSYEGLSEEYAHQVVDHAIEYVRENCHTNGLENFWSLLKRGINGTYVSVEPYHLFRYVDEQAFRFNNREDMNDFDRFKLLLSGIVGKRLTYDALIGSGKEPETAGTREAQITR